MSKKFRKPKNFRSYQEILRRQLDDTLEEPEPQHQDLTNIHVDINGIRIPVNYEPKRKNRFMITFPTELNIPQYFVRRHSKPKLTRSGWSDIEVTLLDPIGPSTSQAVMDYIRGGLWVLNVPFNLTMEMLDPTGVVVERWLLENCQIIEFDFGENDYSSDDLSEVRLIIRPQDCILEF